MGVEHPLEEYKAAYQQHLQRQASDSSKVNCTADQRSRCDKTWQEGWTLRKDNEADEEKCQTVDGIETESVFYSLPDNPCCEYHGCVVRDCKDLRKQWKYDGNKTCTEDDTPNGAEAVCKERVEAKFCGCSVKFCENKRCPTYIQCPACYVKNGQVDECGCQSQQASCDLKLFDPVCEPGNNTCGDKCHRCVVDEEISKECQVKHKGKTVARSHCVKEDCPPNPKCDPCQEVKILPNDECKCPRWECQDRNLDPADVCEVAPNDEKNRPLVRHPINQRAKTRVRNEIRCRSVDAKWAFVKNFQYLRFATWILFTRLLLRRILKSEKMTTMNHTTMKMRTNLTLIV